jgi:pimeloyl-ACP methyl ester carboxylesterase
MGSSMSVIENLSSPTTGIAIRCGSIDRRTGSSHDVELAFETQGNPANPALLMVMGLGAQMYLWPDELVELFVGSGFFVIRFDNRDIGLSSKTAGDTPTLPDLFKVRLRKRPDAVPYLLSDMADDAVAVLDHLKIERAHIIGASMGGMIVQSMAIAYPHRVLSMTSVMSNTGNPKVGQAKPAYAWKLAKLSKGTRGDAVTRSVETARLTAGAHFDEGRARATFTRLVERSFHPHGTRWQVAAITASPDRTEALRRVSVPSLVIHGSLDQLIPLSGGTATAAAIANAKLVVFDDMGHDLPSGRWDDIVASVADFITL